MRWGRASWLAFWIIIGTAALVLFVLYLLVREPWQEVEETYESLAEAKAEGIFPPPSADLLRLADQLEKAAERDYRPHQSLWSRIA